MQQRAAETPVVLARAIGSDEESLTVTTLAGPLTCVSVLAPATGGATELSVAVSVNVPAPRVDVTVAR